ncbi:UDP-N-acetylglucosamine-N-acetylmuramylpentapeptide N-acetylglucosamine transferase [Thermodesulfitimonas autotrophica]|uniref:UDP-N-acetylglucosamine--N-acetylmuramyl-(pentapeptide) pyrophosphoryl-undecaprenol N-acetylglucosamine transferase n=1 Tax=Thermodesulfitimonas autotrophica TaxID=1894989 RepID=A0A3N5AT27_9THEO|nr:undecaprenyldiphospho-muramoylpentapeptide beta-N-acetylglucosaminyltransferase [Thermodesulfitimonas autotrophica]RPF46780.1 UDP-N-acetylglucosamine-N-acetylmuramylpentapeptide N-acetylglucosamine transferase [Thermodesulfitimonas autotrophica]
MGTLRFIIAGGGTGGHIYPALAIARGLKQAFPGCEVLYVGTARGLEADIVPKAGFPFRTITAAGLKRRLTLRNLWSLALALKGAGEAVRLVRDVRPAVVVGTGGYVSGPVLLAAYLCRVPFLIHEQNAFPGLTNRLFARVAACVALTFPEAGRFLPRGVRTKVTGLPVREEIRNADREGARARLNVGEETVLLSFGGSRGAERLNRAIAELIPAFGGRPGVRLFHATGTAGYDKFREWLRIKGIDLSSWGNITVVPYFYQIADYLAAADLVICRAGAATIAELTCLGRPAILVPYPYATANHQEFNARALAAQGAAVVIRDAVLTPERLVEEVERLLAAPAALREMAARSASLGKPDALEQIIACIKEIGRL